MSSDFEIALDLLKEYWVLVTGLGTLIITIAGWVGRLVERRWAKQDQESDRQHDREMAANQHEHELRVLDRQAKLQLEADQERRALRDRIENLENQLAGEKAETAELKQRIEEANRSFQTANQAQVESSLQITWNVEEAEDGQQGEPSVSLERVLSNLRELADEGLGLIEEMEDEMGIADPDLTELAEDLVVVHGIEARMLTSAFNHEADYEQGVATLDGALATGTELLRQYERWLELRNHYTAEQLRRAKPRFGSIPVYLEQARFWRQRMGQNFSRGIDHLQQNTTLQEVELNVGGADYLAYYEVADELIYLTVDGLPGRIVTQLGGFVENPHALARMLARELISA